MAHDRERRRRRRQRVAAEVDFRRTHEPRCPVALRDLSPQGCRIGSRLRLDRGGLVWVRLPSLESLPARVRWVGELESGVEFDRPMHVAVYDMIAGRLARGGG